MSDSIYINIHTHLFDTIVYITFITNERGNKNLKHVWIHGWSGPVHHLLTLLYKIQSCVSSFRRQFHPAFAGVQIVNSQCRGGHQDHRLLRTTIRSPDQLHYFRWWKQGHCYFRAICLFCLTQRNDNYHLKRF